MPPIVPLPKCTHCAEPATTTFPPHVGVNTSSQTIHLCHECLLNKVEKRIEKRKEEDLINRFIRKETA